MKAINRAGVSPSCIHWYSEEGCLSSRLISWFVPILRLAIYKRQPPTCTCSYSASCLEYEMCIKAALLLHKADYPQGRMQ